MTKADRVHSTPPLIASSNNPPDPILTAIAKHKAAYAAYSAAVDRYEALEREGCSIDDARMTQAEQELDAAGDAEIGAAWGLVNFAPSSKDGALELLEYTATIGSWPDEWYPSLLVKLADAINAFFGRTV